MSELLLSSLIIFFYSFFFIEMVTYFSRLTIPFEVQRCYFEFEGIRCDGCDLPKVDDGEERWRKLSRCKSSRSKDKVALLIFDRKMR